MGAAGVVQRALSGCDVLRVYPDFEDWSDSIVDMLLVCALHERCTSEKNNERMGCKERVEVLSEALTLRIVYGVHRGTHIPVNRIRNSDGLLP
jgi:hypothetical protein